MKISIENKDVGVGNFCLTVAFLNDSSEQAGVSLDRFLLNAERVGLEIVHGVERLGPIEYEIVTPNAPVTMRTLAPGEEIKIELPFSIEVKTEKFSALLFKRATYRLSRGAEYAIKLNWDGIVSNELKLTA